MSVETALPVMVAPVSENPEAKVTPPTPITLRSLVALVSATPALRLVAIALFFVTILLTVYSPSINGAFLWDDRRLVQENTLIRSPALTLEIFQHGLHGKNSPYYRPVQNVSFMLDYFLWHENPAGYHLTNILLQAAAGFFLFLVLRNLLPRLAEQTKEVSTRRWDLYAFAIASVWAVHPIHNAAVAYISGRADPLGFAFMAGGAILVFLGSSCSELWKRIAFCSAAAVLAVAALCTKEASVSWLALLLVFTLFFAPRISRNARVGAIAACGGIVGVWWLLRHLPEGVSSATSGFVISWPERIILCTRALGDYVALVFAPVQLMMERSVWRELGQVSVGWKDVVPYLGWRGWLGLGSLGIFIAGLCWKAEGRRLRVFGALWFWLGFLPISNLFPLNAQSAEHWIYTASVGLLLFMAGCLIALRPQAQRIAFIVAMIAILPLGLRTAARSWEWADPVRLFSQTILTSGGTARVYSNLGVELKARGELHKAEKIYLMGIRKFPGYFPLYSNLGVLLVTNGRSQEGEQWLKQANEFAEKNKHLADGTWHSDVTLARVHLKAGRAAEALATIAPAYEKNPDVWLVARLVVEASLAVEGLDKAIARAQEFAVQHWYMKEPRILLAKLWVQKGNLEQALEEYRLAARLDVWYAEPFAEIASIELELGHLDSARKGAQKAVDREPDNAAYRLKLAYVLNALGEKADAAVELMEARRLGLVLPKQEEAGPESLR